MQVTTDLDLLIVAVRNVLRAQARLPAALQTELTGEGVLELLRNIAEHWDDVGGRSADKLASAYPDVSPESIYYTTTEIWVGKVPLSRIRAWLIRVREALIAALAGAGIEVPEDMASMVPGDDELDWPRDRLRYRLWNLPTIDMEDWPKEALPSDVADALAERFWRPRARDSAD